ncbi:MAG: hypothetical protein GF417_10585 [Candidatus Latescibacteria bacterium]|nr:hypothetical protein [bacterium]MBD3424873.1 hypothetical protein [Candidatus Latescibacterota bacterium]
MNSRLTDTVSCAWAEVVFSMAVLSLMLLAVLVILPGCTRDDPVYPGGEEEVDLWVECPVPFAWNRVISIATGDDGTIYALTDDRYLYSRAVEKLYRSEDSGETWVSCPIPEERAFSSLSVDREGNLYALPCHFIGGGVLCYSSDRGLSWDEIESGFSGIDILLFDSVNRGFMVTETGVQKTADGGSRWQTVLEGDLNSLSVSPNDNICTIGDSAIFYSDDSGESWTEIDLPAGEGRILRDVEFHTDNSIYILIEDRYESKMILYHSSGPAWEWESLFVQRGVSSGKVSAGPDDKVFCVFDNYLLRGMDGGEIWELIYSGYRHYYNFLASRNFYGNLELVLSGTGQILAADDNGLFISSDNGGSWFFAGFPTYYVRDLIADSDGRMWIAYAESGIYSSNDSFASFRSRNRGLNNFQPQCLASPDGSSILAGTVEGIFRYTAGGQECTSIGLEELTVKKINVNDRDTIAAIAQSRLYSSYRDGVYGTEDGGDNWEYLGMEGYILNCIEEDIDGYLYVGTKYGGIFRYSGSPESWEQMNRGLPSYLVHGLEPGPGGSLIACTGEGVCRLEKGSARWVSEGLKGMEVTALYSAGDGTLLAASESTVFRKRPGSMEWKVYGATNDPGGNVIRSFRVDRTGYIYALGDFEILWRSPETLEW